MPQIKMLLMYIKTCINAGKTKKNYAWKVVRGKANFIIKAGYMARIMVCVNLQLS